VSVVAQAARILFLDVDGVLNAHGAGWQMKRGIGQLMSEQCAHLERVLSQSKACIVLSSAWRYHYADAPGLRTFEALLHERGVRSAEVVGRTPFGSEFDWPLVPIPGHEPAQMYAGEVRGLEIQRWLDTAEHNVEAFAIVDDSADMAHLAPRLVRTHSMRGLEDHHVDPLVQLLTEGA
jgi:hypothetical protein